jgi:deoxycytidine triphosphate deaminase
MLDKDRIRVTKVEHDSGRGKSMAVLVAGAELQRAVTSSSFIKGGDLRCAEGVKYDLRMGNHLLRAGKNPVNIRDLPEGERSELSLDPGEMAFVLTEETLDLPSNMVAVLSPKRKLSHEGILVLGGFLIDPLYQGGLLVGLYNFSSTKWPLRAGRKLIAVAFYKLVDDELGEFQKPEAIVEFPDELIRVMRNYRPTSLAGVQELIGKVQRDVEILREEFRTQEDWKRTFRESLDRHDHQITELLGGIHDLKKAVEDERVNRLAKETQLDVTLSQISRRGDRSYALWIAIAAAIIGAVFGLVWPSVHEYLKHLP